MKVCVEGPNGIGKTTFIEKVMAELSRNGFKSEYVKLKPLAQHKVLSGRYPKNSLRKEIIAADYLVTELVLEFLDLLEKAEDNDGVIRFFDRGILSTWIYSIAAFQYLTGMITDYRYYNCFKMINTPITTWNSDNEVEYNRNFPRVIQASIDTNKNKCHTMDLNIVLVPSCKTSPLYYESILGRNKEFVIFNCESVFYNVLSQYSNFKDYVNKTKFLHMGTKNGWFPKSYYIANGNTFRIHRVKPDYSNMDKIVSESVETLMIKAKM